jgi:CRP/FNR family transcriptional regulator
MSPICRSRGCSCKATEWAHIEDEKDRELFVRAVHERIYEPGQTIFMQGGDCSGVYCIRSGIVGVRRSDDFGNSAMLRLSQNGDVLGYRALIGKGRHRTTAEVLTPSRVCFIDAARLALLLQRNANLAESFLQRSLADLTATEANCANQMTACLKTRFLHLLFSFYQSRRTEPSDREQTFDLPIQRKDIAALLGTTPESVSRLINKLEERRLVRFVGRRVVFEDLKHLRATMPVGMDS